MGRKRMPGMILRNGIWHIDKAIDGTRICESMGTSRLEEAEKYLAWRRLSTYWKTSISAVFTLMSAG